MRLFTTTILALAITLSLYRPALSAEPDYRGVVKKFIKVMESRDRKAIADLVAYPLHRKVPLPAINTPDQFLRVFDEVLDEGLLKAISASKIADDWSEMGYRGIMFQDGTVWLDENGKITAVNHETEKGKRKRLALVESDRKNLHKSLRQYQEPVLEWRTRDYRIRIDRISDDRYRYAAWPARKQTSEKPDLVLSNGEVIYDGSGGNHHYEFKSGVYVYSCSVNVMGAEDSPPGELEVHKHDKVILTEPVIEVIKGW